MLATIKKEKNTERKNMGTIFHILHTEIKICIMEHFIGPSYLGSAGNNQKLLHIRQMRLIAFIIQFP